MALVKSQRRKNTKSWTLTYSSAPKRRWLLDICASNNTHLHTAAKNLEEDIVITSTAPANCLVSPLNIKHWKEDLVSLSTAWAASGSAWKLNSAHSDTFPIPWGVRFWLLRFWWRSWWRYKKELKHVGEVWEILIVEILVEVLVDIRNIAKGTTDPRVEFCLPK